MYQNVPTKVLTGEVRLSYAHLDKPYANPSQPGAEPKYQQYIASVTPSACMPLNLR